MSSGSPVALAGRVDRAHGRRARPPPVARVLLGAAVLPQLGADRRPAEADQRPVEADEDRLRLARPEIQPEDGPGHAGVVTRRRRTTASRPDRPPRLDTSSGSRNQRRSSKSWPTAAGRERRPRERQRRPGQQRARLGEVVREARLRLAVAVRRVGHPPVRVRDVVEAERRLGVAGAVAPQAGLGIEPVLGQQPPPLARDEVDRVEDEREHRLADEVVEVHPDPAGLDPLAAAGDLALELVASSRGRSPAGGGRTARRTSSRRATGSRTGR